MDSDAAESGHAGESLHIPPGGNDSDEAAVPAILQVEEQQSTKQSIKSSSNQALDAVCKKDSSIDQSHAIESHSDKKQPYSSATIESEVEIRKISPETEDKLTYGLLSHYLPDLQKSKAVLLEVTENQRILIESVQQENAKFSESLDLQQIQQMMAKTKFYHNKLLSIRKDMVTLHDKSSKLKKRAVKLQQQKQKQLLQDEQEHDRQLERERQLVAKLATEKKSYAQ